MPKCRRLRTFSGTFSPAAPALDAAMSGHAAEAGEATERAGPTREPVRVARNPWPPLRSRDDGFTGGVMVTMVDSAKQLTEPDLYELLTAFNNDAKAISRRGYCGTATVEYADAHASIDDVLTALGL